MTDENDSPNETPAPDKRSSRLWFTPGNIFATPAVLRHLHAHNVSVTWLIAMHCAGLWGELDEEDKEANDAAVKSGARILSSYLINGEKVWIITDAVDGLRRRHTTTLLFPSES